MSVMIKGDNMSPEIKKGPQSPEELEVLKTGQIPDEVFDVFNEQIAQNLNRGYAKVLQESVISELTRRGLSRNEIFSRKLLDVEDSYRQVGWKVFYDKPVAWGGDTYEAFFEFSANDEK